MTIDPKALADRFETREGTPVHLCCDCHDLGSDEFLGYQRLIVAALRAYEPPHVHDWSIGGSDGWLWHATARHYYRQCAICGARETTPHLVPAPEVTP